jgi:NADPH2 dehydrogenase
MATYKKVAQLRNAAQFRDYLETLGVDLEFDEVVESGPESPLAQPIDTDWVQIGNRFCVLPMEGWDGTTDGRPTDLTRRRWQRFGLSGAKLIWGGEAVAVRPDGRANPNQLMLNESTLEDITGLREILEQAHRENFGQTNDLYIGLQLTHSGRFARPTDKKRLEPRTAYRHPVLDRKFGIADDKPLLTDDEIRILIDDFVKAAVLAEKAGYAFVDVKHCHGYLGHEFLSAVDREGDFGGSFENRTRFLREITAGIRAEAPGLEIGVRLSAFDFVPFKPGDDRTGVPDSPGAPYRYAFGSDASGLGIDLTEPVRFLDLLTELGIPLVCITAGSPYYNPHIQRPAMFPPSDGYLPPEDPLAGVARQISAVAALKSMRPDLIVVGSGYSYLQEWLPNVAQYAVRTGMVDSVGIGRMVLSYPELPRDVIEGRPMQRKLFCRTFSDCTTAPRNGMVSGCYPLDEFYKAREEYGVLMALKGETES